MEKQALPQPLSLDSSIEAQYSSFLVIEIARQFKDRLLQQVPDNFTIVDISDDGSFQKWLDSSKNSLDPTYCQAVGGILKIIFEQIDSKELLSQDKLHLFINKLSFELTDLAGKAESQKNSEKILNLTRLLSALAVSIYWLNYDLTIFGALVWYVLAGIPISPLIAEPMYQQLQKYGPFSVNNTKLLESSDVKIKDLIDSKKMLQMALDTGLHRNPTLIVKFIRTEFPVLQRKFRKQYEDQILNLENELVRLKVALNEILSNSDKEFKKQQINRKITVITDNLIFLNKSLAEFDGLFESAYQSAIRIEQEQLKLAIGSVSKLGKNRNEKSENPEDVSDNSDIMKELEEELANDSILVRRILSAYEQREQAIAPQLIEQPKPVSK